MNISKNIVLLLGLSLILSACEKDEKPDSLSPGTPYNLPGGETTIFSAGPDAFTFPLANLDAAGIEEHFLADGAFGQQFVSAPAVQFGGLGPVFNQNSCESCHIRNGRGDASTFDGVPGASLLLRISVPGQGEHGAITPVPGFGGQLQHKAMFGVTPEGRISRSEALAIVDFVDGSQSSILVPQYGIEEPYADLPSEIRISPRIAPPVHGLGLLEAITEEDILAWADEGDADGDGISGKPNMVWNVLTQSVEIGRFGWKAEQPTAGQQAADAAHNDMGLTSYYFPEEHCIEQENCTEGLQEGTDLDVETVDLMAFYFQTLAVPAQRNVLDAKVKKGRSLFDQAKCSSCHIPEVTTGPHPISELANQRIQPYTDLLLHDMGEGLSDNRPSFSAEGNEWRTAPLWGIGLTQIVNSNATFMHDGRARTIEEAILWHGGEAQTSQEAYREMSLEERDALLAFLSSL